MADLDPRHAPADRSRAFVEHREGTLVCLAGPGTGKTYSMLERIRALYRGAEPVPPDTICYITFIRNISGEFTNDYIETFTQEGYDAAHPRINTLHAFACKLMRNQGFRIGYKGELHFLNVGDDKDWAAKVFRLDLAMVALNGDVRTEPQLRVQLNAIKEAWQDGVDPATLPAPADHAFQHYPEVARVYRLADWDQTVPTAEAILLDLEEVPTWIASIDHYLVDEYQDFNRAEQSFIARLVAGATSAVIVGDDDQSLYSGRGGSPDGLRGMVANEAHDRVSLVICRRCPANIVAAANRFLAATREGARQMEAHDPGGTIEAKSFKSAKAEVEYLREFLTAKLAALPDNPKPKHGCTCLFPSKKMRKYYRDRLAALGVPCWPTEPADQAQRVWLETVLQLVLRPEQRFLQRLLLQSTYTAVRLRDKKAMLHRMLERDVSPVDALRGLVQEDAIRGKAATAAKEFCDFCSLLERGVTVDIARAMAGPLHVDEAQLTQVIDTFKAEAEAGQEEALTVACDTVLPDSATATRDPHKVEFLTMHSAKGLTRKTVVLPGLEEAWFPSTTADLAEQQRLFYVALTRSTDHLLITLPRTRAPNDPFSYAKTGSGKPSPFIAAAGIALQVVR